MREFKFRAWDGKEMHYPQKHTYVIRFDGVMGKFHEKTNTYTTEDWEVMQFTGATDKYKKDIYEGDIIECEYYGGLPSTQGLPSLVWRGVVKYFSNNTHFSVMTKDGRSYSVGYSGSAVKRWEVIGNIYQNPELLKS